MKRVTFDSNVWTMVARPDLYLKNEFLGSFQWINNAIRCRQILPCLAETVFTLEAVKKVDRKEFLASYEPVIDFSPKLLADGSTEILITIAPDRSHHPGSHPKLSSLLQDALEQGYKLLRCPRIGGIVNSALLDPFFLNDDYVPIGTRQDHFGKCLPAVEKRGCGQAQIIAIGQRHAQDGETWVEGIRKAPDSENGQIAKAFAEWADGDSMAAHIAYGNDYFCTRDKGVSGGPNSILTATNRTWLQEEYDVKILSPDELVEEVRL